MKSFGKLSEKCQGLILGEGEVMEQKFFEIMQQSGVFVINPCETILDLDDPSHYTKMETTLSQKMQVNVFLQNMPLAITAGVMSNAYIVSFPEGLPHTLTALKQGGFSSIVKVDGKFAGSASFYEMSAQTIILGAFTAMSVATGQYFMAQINKKLNLINQKMDKILEFLYGDKKAELMSEISFVQYAYQNFASIMEHDTQKIATISSLQEAKKVAMKDIEFYLGDLDAKVAEEARGFSNLGMIIENAFQIRDSLDLSIQLYIMSSLLEMQFAQNMDKGYISYLEAEIITYIDKCDKRILSNFSSLKGRVDAYKAKPMEKVDKIPSVTKISELIDSLNSGVESDIRKAIRVALHASEKKEEYLVSKDGDIYTLKKD